MLGSSPQPGAWAGRSARTMAGALEPDGSPERVAEKPAADGRKGHEGLVRSAVAWSETLRATFGDRFLGFLLITFAGLKGLSSTLLSTAMLPMFKALHASGDTFQLASLVSAIPWAMKGWMGVLSDCFPICGYHKKSYLIISSFLGMAGVLGLLMANYMSFGVWTIAALFCLINVQFATFDLLSEGKYTELMRENGGGSEAVSFVWCCVNFGGFAGSLLTLGFVDSLGYRPLLELSAPFVLLALVSALRGDLPEFRMTGRRGSGVQWGKLLSEPRLFALAACMAVGALAVAISAVALPSEGQLVVVLSVSVGLVVLGYKALPRTLARSNLYMFLISVAYVDLSGPLGYYYTANATCVPGGPGFSYGYYLAVTNIVGAIGGCIGSVLFQGMQSWSFRKAFWLTTGVQVLAALFDVILVKRWNLAVGISDEAMFLFGDAACQPIAQMLGLMPAALLNSLLCPRGAEATVYAILAGFQNFGLAVASVLGVWLTRFLDIKSGSGGEVGECDYDDLASAIVFGHCILPLLCLPLTFCLVPDVRMNDENAFELVSPAPSFRSPASSIASDNSAGRSPRDSEEEDPTEDMHAFGASNAPYVSLADGPPVVMTGFRTTSVT